jgi:hypothetical protein
MLASTGVKINSLPANTHIGSVFPNLPNKPRFGIHISDSAEAETKRLDNK